MLFVPILLTACAFGDRKVALGWRVQALLTIQQLQRILRLQRSGHVVQHREQFGDAMDDDLLHRHNNHGGALARAAVLEGAPLPRSKVGLKLSHVGTALCLGPDKCLKTAVPVLDPRQQLGLFGLDCFLLAAELGSALAEATKLLHVSVAPPCKKPHPAVVFDVHELGSTLHHGRKPSALVLDVLRRVFPPIEKQPHSTLAVVLGNATHHPDSPDIVRLVLICRPLHPREPPLQRALVVLKDRLEFGVRFQVCPHRRAILSKERWLSSSAALDSILAFGKGSPAYSIQFIVVKAGRERAIRGFVALEGALTALKLGHSVPFAQKRAPLAKHRHPFVHRWVHALHDNPEQFARNRTVLRDHVGKLLEDLDAQFGLESKAGLGGLLLGACNIAPHFCGQFGHHTRRLGRSTCCSLACFGAPAGNLSLIYQRLEQGRSRPSSCQRKLIPFGYFLPRCLDHLKGGERVRVNALSSQVRTIPRISSGGKSKASERQAYPACASAGRGRWPLHRGLL